MMQDVGQADVNHVAAGFRDRLFQVSEGRGYAMLFGKVLPALGVTRVHCHDFRLRDKPVIRFDVNVGDEPRTQQSYLRPRHSGAYCGWLKVMVKRPQNHGDRGPKRECVILSSWRLLNVCDTCASNV